jgi:hypothetical protein
MTDPIGPSHAHSSSHIHPASTDVPVLAKQMQNLSLRMADHLQKILDDPSLTEQSSFLQKMAEDIAKLNATVEQAIKLRG